MPGDLFARVDISLPLRRRAVAAASRLVLHYCATALTREMKEFHSTCQELDLPGLPRKTEEYKTPRRASLAARCASGGELHSLREHHLPETRFIQDYHNAGNYNSVNYHIGGVLIRSLVSFNATD